MEEESDMSLGCRGQNYEDVSSYERKKKKVSKTVQACTYKANWEQERDFSTALHYRIIKLLLTANTHAKLQIPEFKNPQKGAMEKNREHPKNMEDTGHTHHPNQTDCFKWNSHLGIGIYYAKKTDKEQGKEGVQLHICPQPL